MWAEDLEARRLLSGVSWVGKGDGTSWSDPTNWSSGQVPGAGDDVTIDLPGSSIVYDANLGATSIHSLSGNDTLTLAGGSLTVASYSSLRGRLIVDGGALIATGAGTTMTASGLVTAASGSLAAQAGATLSLPGLPSVNGDGMSLGADGSGSTIDLSTVTSFSGFADAISETNGATVLLNSGVTTLDGTTITVDGTGSIPLGQITALTGGGLTVLGGGYWGA
jgi:hypothetical protein